MKCADIVIIAKLLVNRY